MATPNSTFSLIFCIRVRKEYGQINSIHHKYLQPLPIWGTYAVHEDVDIQEKQQKGKIKGRK